MSADGMAPRGAHSTVHARIEAHAQSSPQATAVTTATHRLSYRELDQRANQLAHLLRGRGVGPETVVALCLDRDWQLVVTMLAVLKAGGAFLPLDPHDPPDRLALLLADSAAHTTVTTSRHLDRLGTGGPRTVCLDTERETLRSAPGTKPQAAVLPEHLAYVIYTSGSTGTPKGVQIEHRHLDAFLRTADACYPARDGHGSLLFSSPAFDLPLPSILLPLIQGQDVVVVGGDGADAVEEMARAFSTGLAVSTLKITPSHLELLVQALGRAGGPLDVGSLVVGGEQFRPHLAAAAREVARPGMRVINEYGPTETTVAVVSHLLGPDAGAQGTNVPIGRPMAHADVLIVGPDGNEVADGQVGELWLGGTTVGRGYLNRPGLTADRFVPHPRGAHPGDRMYRSGDLARRLPDGDIEFLGRMDGQIKVRGHRVETDEIEAALNAVPGVRTAVVVARSDARAVV